MSGPQRMADDFQRWPKYRANYIRAFDRMLQRRKKRGKPEIWASAEEVMQWWIYGTDKDYVQIEGQTEMEVE